MQKCLIVVDYQVDFVTGSLGFPAAVTLDAAISEKIAQYRKRDDEILFTLDTHEENYLNTREGRMLPISHCINGTEGHVLYGNVGKMLSRCDKRFFKNTFGSGDLYEYLKNTPFASIELAGIVSNICVLSNAVLARTAQPETPVIVDAACVAGQDRALHQAALAVMAGLQIEVVNRDSKTEADA